MRFTPSSDPFRFDNPVYRRYEWSATKGHRTRLIAHYETESDIRFEIVPPGLFRVFAALEMSKEAILRFASSYGDIQKVGGQLEDASDFRASFSSFEDWTKAISDMQIAVTLWDLTRDRKVGKLRKYIIQSTSGPEYLIRTTDGRTSMGSLNPMHMPYSSHIRYKPGEVLLPARCLLQKIVNEHLAAHPTMPALRWTSNTREDGEQPRQMIAFRPASLLAAMWTQLAQAIIGQLELRRCYCGKYFQVGPGAKRIDATTCDETCKDRRGNDKKKAQREERRISGK